MIIVFFHFQEGHWVWENSGISATFVNWHPGQPNEGRKANCAILVKQNDRWHDVPCTSWAGAKPICQILI